MGEKEHINSPYLIAMWWLITSHGIEGAAIAWTLRALVDALALLGMVRYPLALDLHPLRRLAAITPIGLASLALFRLEAEQRSRRGRSWRWPR